MMANIRSQRSSQDAHGNLYGTTTQGGGGDCSNMRLSGCGTVFEYVAAG